MLVLTRKIGERIVIGERIEIVVGRVDGKKVRLGINAPQDVSIRRPEDQKRSQDGHCAAACRVSNLPVTSDLSHVHRPGDGTGRRP